MTIMIIFLGTLWGFLEATLGGFLHLFRIQIHGALLGSIGFGIMFFALRKGVPAKKIAFIPIIVAGMKLLSSPIFGMPIADPGIIRPVVAILSQGFLFILISNFDKAFTPKRIPVYATTMSTIAIVGFSLFYGFALTTSTFYQILLMTALSTTWFFMIDALRVKVSSFCFKPTTFATVSTLLFSSSYLANWLLR